MGAEYFEHILVDFEPTANWGNWAYRIATTTPREEPREGSKVFVCMCVCARSGVCCVGTLPTDRDNQGASYPGAPSELEDNLFTDLQGTGKGRGERLKRLRERGCKVMGFGVGLNNPLNRGRSCAKGPSRCVAPLFSLSAEALLISQKLTDVGYAPTGVRSGWLRLGVMPYAPHQK